MELQRRRSLAALGLLTLAPGLAASQGAYPTRPVKLIVPFPPGQAADIYARMVAERLAALWKQGVVVENRAGGGGVPGIMAGKQAAPDGYTLIVCTSGTFGVNPAVYAKLPYDPLKDFAPVTNIFIAPLVVVANPAFRAATLQEVVALARSQPGTVDFASAGPGTAQHMTAELFMSMAGIKMVHVPYKGSGPAMTDVIGGQVPLMFDSVTAALPHIRNGRVKALAVTTARRSPLLPDVPTIAEAAVPGFDSAGWSGLAFPVGTPRDIVAKVSADVQALLREDGFAQRILDAGSIPDPGSPEQYAAFIRNEMQKWESVARSANVRLD